MNIELGSAHVVAIFEQRDRVFRGKNGCIGFGLDDLLLGLKQLGLVLLHLVALLAWIEFKNDVALLDCLAVVDEMRQLKSISAYGRRREHYGATGPEFACCLDLEIDVAAFDLANRDFIAFGCQGHAV